MAILTETVIWRRKPRAPRVVGQRTRLTLEQQAHVRNALRVLCARYGSARAVARAMGVYAKTVERIVTRARRPTALLAKRTAELAGVFVEDVITGDFPAHDACPLCGRRSRT